MGFITFVEESTNMPIAINSASVATVRVSQEPGHVNLQLTDGRAVTVSGEFEVVVKRLNLGDQAA